MADGQYDDYSVAELKGMRTALIAAKMSALRGERVEQVTYAGRSVMFAAAAVSMVVPQLDREIFAIGAVIRQRSGRGGSHRVVL